LLNREVGTTSQSKPSLLTHTCIRLSLILKGSHRIYGRLAENFSLNENALRQRRYVTHCSSPRSARHDLHVHRSRSVVKRDRGGSVREYNKGEERRGGGRRAEQSRAEARRGEERRGEEKSVEERRGEERRGEARRRA
jgi:hypothetical protein